MSLAEIIIKNTEMYILTCHISSKMILIFLLLCVWSNFEHFFNFPARPSLWALGHRVVSVVWCHHTSSNFSLKVFSLVNLSTRALPHISTQLHCINWTRHFTLCMKHTGMRSFFLTFVSAAWVVRHTKYCDFQVPKDKRQLYHYSPIQLNSLDCTILPSSTSVTPLLGCEQNGTVSPAVRFCYWLV